MLVSVGEPQSLLEMVSVICVGFLQPIARSDAVAPSHAAAVEPRRCAMLPIHNNLGEEAARRRGTIASRARSCQSGQGGWPWAGNGKGRYL